jgi:lysozyme family protein
MSTPDPRLTAEMADILEPIIDEVIGIEGGFVDDPNDAGGATRWGVTEAVARAHGYKGRMQDYPREQAVDVYEKNYFLDPNFHLIATHSKAVAKELFEIEVNCPPGVAAKFMQRALRVLNDPKGNGQVIFPDVDVDGRIGGDTASALSAFLKYRGKGGEVVLLKMINAQQAVYYIERAEKRPQNERFEYGWIANRVAI